MTTLLDTADQASLIWHRLQPYWIKDGTTRMLAGDLGSVDEICMVAYGPGYADLPEESLADYRDAMAWGALWCAYWAEDGFCSLTTSAKYAAALMATDHGYAVEAFRQPARAIRLALPEHALPTLDGITPVAVQWLNAGDQCHVALEGREGGRRSMSAPSIADLLSGDPKWSLGGSEAAGRAMLCAVRLLVGLVHSHAHTEHWTEQIRENRPDSVARRVGAPSHRRFTIGRTIDVDLRPYVREYIASGDTGASPTVQSVVRGHYKRQVVGIGRTGRKVIWIEPYWRGPEEAPIAVRNYDIGVDRA